MYLIFPILSLYLQTFDLVAFDMSRRINTNNQTIRSDATIYFKSNGTMITQYGAPLDMLIFNNADGEVKIYNEKDNTVMQSVNHNASTIYSDFYFFLNSETEDMGLRKLGFTLKNTRVEDGLFITTWLAPFDMRAQFAEVELVHKGDQPVFMGYKSAKGAYMKKVFYYNYFNLNTYVSFPAAITEIDYMEKDSVVTKTEFSNYQFDGQVDAGIFDYIIPPDAKVIK